MEKIEIKGLDEIIYYDKCLNGLEIYLLVNEKVNACYMSFTTKFGSTTLDYQINNQKYHLTPGTAHFLEHLKFQEKEGTAHEFFNKMGADANAFTTFNYTSYVLYLLDNFEANLVHLLDYVQTPYFNKKMVQNEKGIITEETKMGYDDPNIVSFYGLLNNLFLKSNYQYLVTGTTEDIKKISLKDIENAYQHFYHPENMFIVITGNFNPYEAIKIIKDNQSKKIFSKYNKPVINKAKEPTKVRKELEVKKGNVKSSKGKIALKIAKANFKDLDDYSLSIILSLILNVNFGSTSDFKESLTQNNLVTDLSYSSDIYDDYIILLLSFETDYEEEVLKLLNNELNNLKVDEASFKRKINAFIATLILGYDDIENVNNKIGENIILYNEVIDNAKERLEKITYEDVKKVLNKVKTKYKSTYLLTK